MNAVPSPQMFMSNPPPQLKSCQATTNATKAYSIANDNAILLSLIETTSLRWLPESEIRAVRSTVIQLNYELPTCSNPRRIGFPNKCVLVIGRIIAQTTTTGS